MPVHADPPRHLLFTSDGVTLIARHLPFIGPEQTMDRPIGAEPSAGDLAAVVAPGFSGSAERAHVRRVAEGLQPYAGVILVDPRGHGGSGGLSTLGDREVLDVDAAVLHARRLGYRQVVTVGWSMGGSAVLRQAALVHGGEVYGHPVNGRVDAVVSVSATSRWFVRDTAPMRRLHRLVETRGGRLVARGLFHVKIDPRGWTVLPPSPLELVAQISPTPLLVVHGDSDSYFTLEHPRALYDAARAPKELWIVPGFGHAEVAATPELIDRIGRHLATLIAAGDRREGAPCPG